MADRDFWAGKHVFLTGHTGFKGAWLYEWLTELGAQVTGYALPPHAEPSLAQALGFAGDRADDVREAARVAAAMHGAAPDIVIHLAAQALVGDGLRDPLRTLSTNVLGSAHVLSAAIGIAQIQVALMITSDKVYANHGEPKSFREDDVLGGFDPYSASKASAEHVAAAWRGTLSRPGLTIATARAGNVIGGGDWARERIVPDVVRAWRAGEPVLLRQPNSTRPWQHVLDALDGYLQLVEGLWAGRIAARSINFGPDPGTELGASAVVEQLQGRLPGSRGWQSGAAPLEGEAPRLALDSGLARRVLGWRPRLDVATALDWSADWYREFYAGAPAAELCRAQIRRHQALAR